MACMYHDHVLQITTGMHIIKPTKMFLQNEKINKFQKSKMRCVRRTPEVSPCTAFIFYVYYVIRYCIINISYIISCDFCSVVKSIVHVALTTPV